jgi:hypothetical protein
MANGFAAGGQLTTTTDRARPLPLPSRPALTRAQSKTSRAFPRASSARS